MKHASTRYNNLVARRRRIFFSIHTLLLSISPFQNDLENHWYHQYFRYPNLKTTGQRGWCSKKPLGKRPGGLKTTGAAAENHGGILEPWGQKTMGERIFSEKPWGHAPMVPMETMGGKIPCVSPLVTSRIPEIFSLRRAPKSGLSQNLISWIVGGIDQLDISWWAWKSG